jgi:hypothetical protein
LPCTFDRWVHILDFYLQGFYYYLSYGQGGAFQILTKKKNPCREVLVKYKEKKSKYYFRFEKRLIETFLSKALYYLQ